MDKIIDIKEENYNEFDLIAPHVVQSTLWGRFRNSLGSKTYYLGQVHDDKIINAWMLYTTSIPGTKGKLKIGVITQSCPPTKALLEKLKEIAKKEHLLFIKIEPLLEDKKEVEVLSLKKGKDLFLKNTFILDLKSFLTFEDVFNNFSTSTRRNIRIAEKKGVSVKIHEYEGGNYEALDTFYDIQEETTKRQKYAAHKKSYYKKMYDILKEHMVILEAAYEGETIASMILFIFNNTCYYPYGASMHKYIDTKSTNLLVKTALQYAFEKDLTFFNFWGALEENPDPHDPLIGVHNFKKGFGGNLHQYIGAYDLVINPITYSVFNLTYNFYWKFRKLLRKF